MVRAQIQITLRRLTLTVLAFAAAYTISAADNSTSFATTVRPVLEKYCLACHGVKSKKGEVDLATFKTEADLGKDPDRWKHLA